MMKDKIPTDEIELEESRSMPDNIKYVGWGTRY